MRKIKLGLSKIPENLNKSVQELTDCIAPVEGPSDDEGDTGPVAKLNGPPTMI